MEERIEEKEEEKRKREKRALVGVPACLVPYRHMIFCRMGRAKRNPSKYRLQPIIISPCPASQSRRMLPKSKIKSMITRGRRLCLRRAGNFIQCFADCCGIHRADQTGNFLTVPQKDQGRPECYAKGSPQRAALAILNFDMPYPRMPGES